MHMGGSIGPTSHTLGAEVTVSHLAAKCQLTSQEDTFLEAAPQGPLLPFVPG